MVEDTPGVKNKGLLITALVVGVIVVLLYNFQIDQVRKAGRGESKSVLAFQQGYDAGKTIEEHSLKTVRVDVDFVEGLGDVVLKEDLDDVIGKKLETRVTGGHFLRWGHIQGHKGSSFSSRISDGMVGHTVEIDRSLSPGQVLSQGDRIMLMGILPINGKLGVHVIIDGVRVLAIGGVPGAEVGNKVKRRAVSSGRTYSRLTIEVSPETAKQLASIKTHLQGAMWVEVMSAGGDGGRSPNPQVARELRDLRPQPR